MQATEKPFESEEKSGNKEKKNEERKYRKSQTTAIYIFTFTFFCTWKFMSFSITYFGKTCIPLHNILELSKVLVYIRFGTSKILLGI